MDMPVPRPLPAGPESSGLLPICVRPVCDADFARWLPLWEGYASFYECALPQAVTDCTFARLLDPQEPVWGGVAERDGVLLGMVTCVLHRSTWSLTHYAYLEDLFVAQQARGLGVGRALMEWVQQLARTHNCSRLYWHTRHDNRQAQQLYDRLARQSGFIEYRMDL